MQSTLLTWDLNLSSLRTYTHPKKRKFIDVNNGKWLIQATKIWREVYVEKLRKIKIKCFNWAVLHSVKKLN